jgi:hypothetical protein
MGMLDTGVGGAVVFSLTPGLQASWKTPNPDEIDVNLDAANSPQKQGETRDVEILIIGIPRLTDETKSVATDTQATLPGSAAISA